MKEEFIKSAVKPKTVKGKTAESLYDEICESLSFDIMDVTYFSKIEFDIIAKEFSEKYDVNFVLELASYFNHHNCEVISCASWSPEHGKWLDGIEDYDDTVIEAISDFYIKWKYGLVNLAISMLKTKSDFDQFDLFKSEIMYDGNTSNTDEYYENLTIEQIKEIIEPILLESKEV